MTSFFFYNKLKNPELINKIQKDVVITDGYIKVNEYNENVLIINDNNNKILYGKIVEFTLNLEDIIKKINNIEECKINKTKYTLKKVIGYTMIENTRELYIIY
jgi:hypothetical protein